MAKYKYEFVRELPADFTCPICLDAVIGARQTSCCGHHLCQFCAETTANKVCPVCQNERMTSIPDLYFRRKLNQMLVYCSHKSKGCPWTGELNDVDEHLERCGFELVACSYGCDQRVQRRELDEHNSLCMKRPYSCEYCLYKATYEDVTKVHWPVCETYPVDCPNGCSRSQRIARSDLQNHLSTECPLQEVECEFRYAGCHDKVIRENHSEHIDTHTQSHISLVSAQVQHLLKTLTIREIEMDELRREVEHLKEQLASSKALSYQESGIFVLRNPKHYKTAPWCSPPFLSRPHGYKMGFKVLFKAGSLQMFVYLIGGEYDDKLSWPFQGNISIMVLNQLQDQSSHDYRYQFTYRGGTPEQIAGRAELGQCNGDMPTSSRYLTTKDLDLSHDGECQYLVNNCLRFRVSKIITTPGGVTTTTNPGGVTSPKRDVYENVG